MASNESNEPPKLKINVDGAPDVASIADLLEWFLQRDQRVGMIRHPHVEELFQWKRRDDESHGQEKAPFDSAEARFAIGSIQALMENRDELSLQLWMTNLLQALGEAKGNQRRSRETVRARHIELPHRRIAETSNNDRAATVSDQLVA